MKLAKEASMKIKNKIVRNEMLNLLNISINRKK